MRFSLDDAQKASDDWGFNCGPAALCAVLGMTPDEIRPHMGDFERKRYTNPQLMYDVLHGLGVDWLAAYTGHLSSPVLDRDNALTRIQWGGPWTRPGTPTRARYRHTHWIAQRPGFVFDINAMCAGGWIPLSEWVEQLAPWLIRECCPKGDGTFWPTHVLEIERISDGPQKSTVSELGQANRVCALHRRRCHQHR